MTVLDVLLLLVCASFAWSGYRRGFLIGVASFVGFVGGGIVGAKLVPRLLTAPTPGTGTALGAVAIVVACATVGQLALGLVAARVRGLLSWRPIRVVDSAAGALLGLGSVLLVAWFLATAVRQAPVPSLSAQVADSRVLAAVDDVMPADADRLFRSFRSAIDAGGFPAVFEGLTPEPITAVDPPDPGVSGTAAVRRAAASIVRIDGAASCRRMVEGSGFVFAPERVMTNAHVVAGVDAPVVRVGGTGGPRRATVVLFDPERDIAVLAVPGLDAPALRFDASAERSDTAVVAGFPQAGPYRLDAARIRSRIDARGSDIYDRGTVQRSVLALYARVQPGNSGGPLLSPQGAVYGVVFAKSLDDDTTGYALSAQEVASAAARGRAASRAVDTQGCAA